MASIALNQTFGERYEQANPFINKFAGAETRYYKVSTGNTDSGWAYAQVEFEGSKGKTGIVSFIQACATKGSPTLKSWATGIIKQADRDSKTLELGDDFPSKVKLAFDTNGNITKVTK